MNKKLVVIGGGIIGITIARNAALKNLFSDITVIEKEINLANCKFFQKILVLFY